MKPWLQAVRIRLPILVLTFGLTALYVALPYQGLDADATTFGLMGNDLLRHGYLPIFPYGQTYLFSLTPYVYAGVRMLLPAAVPHVVSFALAGALLSMGGLWLIYESLIAVQRRTGGRLFPAGLLFCLFVAASPCFVFDLSVNSSSEMAMFLLGVLLFLFSRMENTNLSDRGRLRLWFFIGMVCSFSYLARPQVTAYGVLMAGLLFHGMRKRMDPLVKKILAVFAGGAVLGCLPMILHLCFRAQHWPFHHKVRFSSGHLPQIARAAKVVCCDIMGRVFSVPSDPAWMGIAVVVLLLCIPVVFFVLRRRGQGSLLDTGLVAGSLLVLLVAIYPVMSPNSACSRYCLSLLPAVGWLLARWFTRDRRMLAAAVVVMLVLVVLRLGFWKERMQEQTIRNRECRDIQLQLVPVLEKEGCPVLADYWNAYLIAFLADGRIKVDAYPWDWVRTYGLISRAEMDKKCLWLVVSGHGGATWRRLAEELKIPAGRFLDATPLSETVFGRECELWKLPQAGDSSLLMDRHQRGYFTTTYPPGSRPKSE